MVRQSKMDACVQKLVPVPFCARVVYKAQYPVLADNTSERRTQDKLQREFYWPHLASDVYINVAKCQSCVQ